ncbi:hypothetical protein PUN28_011582 [Cardiocondyla obscurior]|uniref:Uncharacterized protein n=1 Tax=Cardiocondyla obscurior TaxID=286306 RepID=A0AAW2FGS1_9HYME
MKRQRRYFHQIVFDLENREDRLYGHGNKESDAGVSRPAGGMRDPPCPPFAMHDTSEGTSARSHRRERSEYRRHRPIFSPPSTRHLHLCSMEKTRASGRDNICS